MVFMPFIYFFRNHGYLQFNRKESLDMFKGLAMSSKSQVHQQDFNYI